MNRCRNHVWLHMLNLHSCSKTIATAYQVEYPAKLIMCFNFMLGLSPLVVEGHQSDNSQASKEDGEPQQDANHRPNETVMVPVIVCQVSLNSGRVSSRYRDLQPSGQYV